jgi:hypothetical protein
MGAVRLNWAAFYSEYSDNLQTTIFKGVGFAVKQRGVVRGSRV